MSVNDPLGDMLTRIRNAQLRRKSKVRTPASKLRGWVLDVLQSEGYIRRRRSGASGSAKSAKTFSPATPRRFRRRRRG